jgi:hypothetical protein
MRVFFISFGRRVVATTVRLRTVHYDKAASSRLVERHNATF